VIGGQLRRRRHCSLPRRLAGLICYSPPVGASRDRVLGRDWIGLVWYGTEWAGDQNSRSGIDLWDRVAWDEKIDRWRELQFESESESSPNCDDFVNVNAAQSKQDCKSGSKACSQRALPPPSKRASSLPHGIYPNVAAISAGPEFLEARGERKIQSPLYIYIGLI